MALRCDHRSLPRPQPHPQSACRQVRRFAVTDSNVLITERPAPAKLPLRASCTARRAKSPSSRSTAALAIADRFGARWPRARPLPTRSRARRPFRAGCRRNGLPRHDRRAADRRPRQAARIVEENASSGSAATPRWPSRHGSSRRPMPCHQDAVRDRRFRGTCSIASACHRPAAAAATSEDSRRSRVTSFAGRRGLPARTAVVRASGCRPARLRLGSNVRELRHAATRLSRGNKAIALEHLPAEL